MGNTKFNKKYGGFLCGKLKVGECDKWLPNQPKIDDFDSFFSEWDGFDSTAEEIASCNVPTESLGTFTAPLRKPDPPIDPPIKPKPIPGPTREVVVDRNGQPRQAGADLPEGEFVKRLKKRAEENLYVFSKAIMGRSYLTKDLHLPLCQSLQKCPPYRKLRLWPRAHAKTSVVSHCLPPHILIQPAESNLYFPGLQGTECRILLSGETERMAKKNHRVVKAAFEGNQLLRAFWPHAVWENSKRDSPAWNDHELILPRETDYPDASIKAIGVGGAITGARPNVLIKDDLVTLTAANSDLEMESAIEWHKVSRALMDEYEKTTGMESLEFIAGTRWAVYDLYSYIIDNDPSVDVDIRAIVEEGKCIWSERFNSAKVEQLMKEYGSLFYLLYMNSVADPSLTDFNIDLIRDFKFINDGQHIEYTEDERDNWLVKKATDGSLEAEKPPPRGQLLNGDTWSLVFGKGDGRKEWMRLKYA